MIVRHPTEPSCKRNYRNNTLICKTATSDGGKALFPITEDPNNELFTCCCRQPHASANQTTNGSNITCANGQNAITTKSEPIAYSYAAMANVTVDPKN